MSNDLPPAGTSDLFRTLTRESSLVTRVVEQIERLIVEGKLRVGDPLPPEKRLAAACGVSRTVIREAMARLEARQLVRAQPNGGRLVVSAPSPESVGRSMSLMLQLGREPIPHEKVLEVRRLIEVEIAALAAERRTETDAQRLTEIIAEAEKCLDRPVRLPPLDVEFHRALALATQNELYVVLLDAIADTLMEYRRLAMRVPGAPGLAWRHHRAIFEQVSAGSVSGARAAMRDHMLEAEQTIRQARAQQKGEPS